MTRMSENDCNSSRLTFYCLDELSAEERYLVGEHLARCPECREALGEIQEVLHRSKEQCEVTHREARDFTNRVMAQVEGRRYSKFLASSWRGGLAVVSTVLLAFLISPHSPESLPTSSGGGNDAYELTRAEQIELLNDMELLENLTLLEKLVVEQG